MGTHLDVTMARDEELARGAVEAAEVGAFDWDLTRGRFEGSTALWRLWGLAPGADAGSLLDCLQAADKAVLTAAVARCTPQSDRFACGLCVRWQDGTVRRSAVRGGVSFDAGGTAVRARGAVMDIDARFQESANAEIEASAALLRIAVNAARIGGFRISLPSYQTHLSDEVRAIRDFPPGYWPTMEEAVEGYEPEYRPAIFAAVRACAERGTPYDLEVRLVTPKKRRLWVRLMGEPRRNAEGHVVEIVGALQDIDESKRLEQQLRQSQKMEAVGQLAGGVAHDFNNLLSVILSYSSMMLAELPAEAPTRADLQEINRAGERARVLTAQLLAFSRQQIIQPRVVELTQLVHGVESMLRRLITESIELSLLTSRNVGKIFADPGQVEQVLMNLVVNARDAMPAGGTISIETADVELTPEYAEQHYGVVPGPYVMLAVTDTGVGMTAATMERIFEPFYTTKDQGQGTGLGLATVFGIVKQSSGHIWVYSEPGVGTTFKVYFPRTDLPVEPTVKPVHEAARLKGTETILLVEDDQQVRVLIRSVLRGYGYNVLDAQNGGEAFLTAEQFPGKIHLLLTDVVMPRMTGRQLAERLVGMKPDLRVLYISGYTENSIVHHGVLDAGIAFLSKPVTPEALARKVREVLDGR
ncbi:MAG: response regulator [Polyangiaceae bacterium]|nr:response regulator [Polyangiaceae bacterium]